MSQLVTRISTNSITVVLDGKVRVVNQNAANFKRLAEALKVPTIKRDNAYLDLIRDLVDISSFVARETCGDVQVSENQVRWKGAVQNGVLATRIIQHLTEGYSITPLANFMNKLMQNPSTDVREDLFAWLESGDTPITEDGDIIAYKKVQPDYYSYHSGKHGKVLHAMGSVVQIPREDVDLNRRNECSNGLHFCSYGYLSNYHGGQGRVLIVKINPADVDAIPTDYQRQKGRTHRMFVYDEIAESEAEKAMRGKLIAPKTGVVETETTARISGPDDNSLGVDGSKEVITIGRLRGLLAHGGIAYTAKELKLSEERVDSLAEMIDFKAENLGDLTKTKPTPAPVKAPDVVNNPQVTTFIAKFGGSLAHAIRAKAASDAGKSAHDALFKDTELNGIVRNISNVASFDAAVNDIFGNTKPLKVKVSAKKTKIVKQKTGKTSVPKSKIKAAVKAVKTALAPTKPAPTDVTFTDKAGNNYTAQFIADGVKTNGQRGFSAMTGIPRTTLQTWLAQIKA